MLDLQRIYSDKKNQTKPNENKTRTTEAPPKVISKCNSIHLTTLTLLNSYVVQYNYMISLRYTGEIV